MSDVCLFTKYHIKRHLFYIGSLLQTFAVSYRTEIFHELKKKIISREKVKFQKQLLRGRKEEKNLIAKNMHQFAQKEHINLPPLWLKCILYIWIKKDLEFKMSKAFFNDLRV